MFGTLNGFPYCLQKIDVSNYEEWETQSGTTSYNVDSLTSDQLSYNIRVSLRNAVDAAWPYYEEYDSDGETTIVEDRSDGCNGVLCNRTPYRMYNGSVNDEGNFVGYGILQCPSASIYTESERREVTMHGFDEISGFISTPPRKYLTETNTSTSGAPGECEPSKLSEANAKVTYASGDLANATHALNLAESDVENALLLLQNAIGPENISVAQGILLDAQNALSAAESAEMEADLNLNQSLLELDDEQAVYDSNQGSISAAQLEVTNAQSEFDLAQTASDNAEALAIETSETYTDRASQVTESNEYSDNIIGLGDEIDNKIQSATDSTNLAIEQATEAQAQSERIKELADQIQEYADEAAEAVKVNDPIEEAAAASRAQFATTQLIQDSINTAQLASTAAQSANGAGELLQEASVASISMRTDAQRSVDTLQEIATDSGIEGDQESADDLQDIANTINTASGDLANIAASAQDAGSGTSAASEIVIAGAHALTVTADIKTRATLATEAEEEAAAALALSVEVANAAQMAMDAAISQSSIVSDALYQAGILISRGNSYNTTSISDTESILQDAKDDADQAFDDTEEPLQLLEAARVALKQKCENKDEASRVAANENYSDGGDCCGDGYHDGTTSEMYTREGVFSKSGSFNYYYQNGDILSTTGSASRSPCSCGQPCTNTASIWYDPPPCVMMRTTILSDEYTEEMATEDTTPTFKTSSSMGESRWEVRRSGFDFWKWTCSYEIKCTGLNEGMRYRVAPSIRRRAVSRGIAGGGYDGFEVGPREDVEVLPVEFIATSNTHTINNGGQLIELDHVQGYEYVIWRADIEIIDYNLNV